MNDGGSWRTYIDRVTASPARMRVFERRALTPDEIALGRGVFGDSIAWDRIRIFQAPPLGFGAMVPLGRTIVFSRWRAARDFAQTEIGEQGWFVHELMHVLQATRGKVLALSKLRAMGKRAYICHPRDGACLAHYNIEAQAEIARFLFLARQGAVMDAMPARHWLEDVWARG